MRNARFRRIVPLMTCLGLLIPPVASADVYKCTIQGEVRYQDSPCPGQAGQAPHIEVAAPATTGAPVAAGDAPAEAGGGPRGDNPPSGPAVADDEPLDALGELYFAHRSAQEEQRDLQRQYREQVRKLAAAQSGKADTEEAAWQRRELERTWRERQLSAAERTQRLQARLSAACPNGLLMQRGRPACR